MTCSKLFRLGATEETGVAYEYERCNSRGNVSWKSRNTNWAKASCSTCRIGRTIQTRCTRKRENCHAGKRQQVKAHAVRHDHRERRHRGVIRNPKKSRRQCATEHVTTAM